VRRSSPCDATHSAVRYLIVGGSGLKGAIATLIGKDPPDIRYWVSSGVAPASEVRGRDGLKADLDDRAGHAALVEQALSSRTRGARAHGQRRTIGTRRERLADQAAPATSRAAGAARP
jgi:hypothetical protein